MGTDRLDQESLIKLQLKTRVHVQPNSRKLGIGSWRMHNIILELLSLSFGWKPTLAECSDWLKANMLAGPHSAAAMATTEPQWNGCKDCG